MGGCHPFGCGAGIWGILKGGSCWFPGGGVVGVVVGGGVVSPLWEDFLMCPIHALPYFFPTSGISF